MEIVETYKGYEICKKEKKGKTLFSVNPYPLAHPVSSHFSLKSAKKRIERVIKYLENSNVAKAYVRGEYITVCFNEKDSPTNGLSADQRYNTWSGSLYSKSRLVEEPELNRTGLYLQVF